MKKDHIYFIQIGEDCERLYKIGTTNDMKRRMKEHEHNYKKKIKILWESPAYSKWTTLRVEQKMIDLWKTFEGFEYIRNDRFIISPEIKQIVIKVRKDWVVEF